MAVICEKNIIMDNKMEQQQLYLKKLVDRDTRFYGEYRMIIKLQNNISDREGQQKLKRRKTYAIKQKENIYQYMVELRKSMTMFIRTD